MSKNDPLAWLTQASTEAIGDASVSINTDKNLLTDAANPVPGDHTEKGQGSMDAKTTDLKIDEPADLGVTDAPQKGKDITDDLPESADELLGKVIGDQPAGKETLGAANVSTEELHPTEPVVGGKLPDESKMDENIRGTLEHVGAAKAEVHVDAKDADTDVGKGEDEHKEDPAELLGDMKDNNPGTHVPGQTKVAQNALEGHLETDAHVQRVQASIEEHSAADLTDQTSLVQHGDTPNKEQPVDGEPETHGEDTPPLHADNTSVSTEEVAHIEEAGIAGNVGEGVGDNTAAQVEVSATTPGATGEAAAVIADANAEQPGEVVGAAVPEGAGEAPPTELGAAIADITGQASESPVQEAAEHMNEVADDLAEMEKMSVAIEAYGELLSQNLAQDGVISPLLARAVAIGLEAFDEPFLLVAGETGRATVASMEDFSDPTIKFAVSTEALDNLKQKAGELAKALQGAVAKLFEWLMDLWNKLVTDANLLKARVAEAKTRAGSITSENSKPFPLKGASRLYIMDFFAGDTPQPLVDLNKSANAFMVQYPKMMNSVLNGYKGNIRNALANLDAKLLGTSHLRGAWVASFEDHFKPNMLNAKPVQGNDIPESYKRFEAVAATPVMPGNMAMYVGMSPPEAKEGSSEQETAATGLNKYFRISFERRPGTAPISETIEVKVPNAQVIKVMLDRLDDICDTMMDIKSEINNMGTLRIQLTRLANEMSGDVMRSDAARSMYLSLVRSFAKDATVPLGNFTGYLASIVKAYLAVLNGYISHHGGDAAKAEAA